MQELLRDQFFYRLDRVERPICTTLNALAENPAIHKTFVVFSKLGDGPLWILLMIVIGLTTPDAGNLPAVLIGASLFNLVIYKLMKGQTLRNRPCTTWEAINPGTPPLDHYSFPSGHTLHAVTITLICLSALPMLGAFLVPIMLMIALSRVILGLHYPTDVLVASGLGYVVAVVAEQFIYL